MIPWHQVFGEYEEQPDHWHWVKFFTDFDSNDQQRDCFRNLTKQVLADDFVPVLPDQGYIGWCWTGLDAIGKLFTIRDARPQLLRVNIQFMLCLSHLSLSTIDKYKYKTMKISLN